MEFLIGFLLLVSLLFLFGCGPATGSSRSNSCNNCKHLESIKGDHGRKGYYKCNEFNEKLGYYNHYYAARCEECHNKYGETQDDA